LTSQGSNYNPADFEGDNVGPNGTWYTYSLQSNGNVWSTYVNGVLYGWVNLGTSNSGGNPPYAIAEVDAYTTKTILPPVEFRYLAYRDTNDVWHNVSSATAYIGYAYGSERVPSGEFPNYGVQVVGVNDWLAGSGLPQRGNGQLLWLVPETTTTTASSTDFSPYDEVGYVFQNGVLRP
jgi:hypothetical protein